MFGTIRKHQTWLWAVIITVTIISFVVFFSPYSRVNNGGRGAGDFGSINGEKIAMDDYLKAKQEVYLQYFFMSGGQLLNNEEEAKKMGFDVEQRTYARLFLIQEQERLGIHVASDVAAQFATEMMKPLAQKLQAASPQQVIDEVIKRYGMSMADFERFVRHELGIQELISTVGLSGKLVTPDEAKALYIRERQELSTQVALFSASNFLSQITVKPEDIGLFYTNQMAAYRLPERVQVSYVKFDPSNYMAQAEKDITNLNEIVEANLAKLGTNVFKDAKTPEEKKAKVREEVIRASAYNRAQKAAVDFARPLLEVEQVKAEALVASAKTNGLEVRVTEPFDRENGPKGMDVEQSFTKAAFALSPSDPISQLVRERDGIYLLAYNKTIPSEVPPLNQIRDRVTADFKFMKAAQAARSAGLAFEQTATNGLAQGKSFESIAAAAKVQPLSLPPFSLSTRDLPELEGKAPFDTVKELAVSTSPGKVSNFQPTRDGGLMVYMKSRLPVDENKMKNDMPNFLAYVRQSRQREAFDMWFRREAEKALRDTPVMRPQTQPANMKQRAAK